MIVLTKADASKNRVASKSPPATIACFHWAYADMFTASLKDYKLHNFYSYMCQYVVKYISGPHDSSNISIKYFFYTVMIMVLSIVVYFELRNKRPQHRNGHSAQNFQVPLVSH